MGQYEFVRQNFTAVSPFAITEVGANAATLAGIYQGNQDAVSAGFPATGIIPFLRVGSDDIGEANTNIKRQGSFDWLFDVERIGLKMVFPRSIVDGADLLDASGAPVPDNLAARKLASRYTRIAELYFNHTRLLFQIVETKILDVKLTWVGSGPSTVVEGLSIQHGPDQSFTTGVDPVVEVNPSVAAFSVRTGGNGKKDLWNLGRVRIEELRTITLQTYTDGAIVDQINTLLASGNLYEDAKIGIRIKAYLLGPRTKKANYGAQ